MWKGPFHGGITQSLLNAYLEDPYSFYIYAILGLKEPGPLPENLVWGDCYHVGLEHLIKTKDLQFSLKKMMEHLDHKHPSAPPSFRYSLWRMLCLYPYKSDILQAEYETEEIIEEIIEVDGMAVKLRGKRDAITREHPDYGTVLGEHKCKGRTDPETTRKELWLDLQLNMYLRTLDKPCERIFYDLILIPDTQKYGPQMSYGESPEDWITRIYCGPVGSYNGMYPINKNPNRWIRQLVLTITEEEQEQVWNYSTLPCIKRLIQFYDHVTQPGFDPDNPKYYNEVFYRHPMRTFSPRKTDSYKGNYYDLLIGEQDYGDLVPVESYFSELEDV